MTIAVAKLIGTLAPALPQGVLWGFNQYIFQTGLVCSVFDILYIVLLRRFRQKEARA